MDNVLYNNNQPAIISPCQTEANMPPYFSQTDDVSLVELNQQTTSAVLSLEKRVYEFNKAPIVFIDNNGVPGEDLISEETEKNFYKKAFETKNLPT